MMFHFARLVKRYMCFVVIKYHFPLCKSTTLPLFCLLYYHFYLYCTISLYTFCEFFNLIFMKRFTYYNFMNCFMKIKLKNSQNVYREIVQYR